MRFSLPAPTDGLVWDVWRAAGGLSFGDKKVQHLCDSYERGGFAYRVKWSTSESGASAWAQTRVSIGDADLWPVQLTMELKALEQVQGTIEEVEKRLDVMGEADERVRRLRTKWSICGFGENQPLSGPGSNCWPLPVFALFHAAFRS